MKENKTGAFENTKNLDGMELKLKEHLKNMLTEELYNTWVDNFALEKVDLNRVVVGYYGTRSIRELSKEHKKIISEGIFSVLGFGKELVIKKRKGKNLSPVPKNPKTRKNIKTAKLFVISMFFVALALAFALVMASYIGNRNFRESFYAVSSLKIDNSVRVIHLSDLHSCSYGKNNKKIIDRVTALEPDVIIMTGDMVDSDKEDMSNVMSLCKGISKVAPAYYIYGNNEVEKVYPFPLSKKAMDKEFGFTDENRDERKINEMPDSLESQLESTGVKVLKNEKDTITVGTTGIDIYGVLTSNPSAFWDYTEESFAGYIYENPDNLKITAIHEPFIFEEFTDHDFWGDLMVCGHTHGGQTRVPVLGPLYTREGGLFPERSGGYVYGRYPVAGRPLIVSGGLENTGVFRINNEPEIVIIDINKF